MTDVLAGLRSRSITSVFKAELYFEGIPVKLLKTAGLVCGMLALAPSVQAAQLTFGFDAFIPTPRVVNPVADVLPPFFTEFIGDDRDFDVDATLNGEAHLFTQVVLDTDAPDLIVSTDSGSGTTIGFLIEEGVEVFQSAQATPTVAVEATRVSEDEILLEVAARATNPLIENFLPPEVEVFPAEYIYDIALTFLDEGISYDLTGTTREYPSYSVFLNRSPLLLNPANGEDSLLLGNIEPVSASGIVPVSESLAHCSHWA